MDEKEKSFLDRITSPLTGDYRKKKPISVKAADVAVGMTPVGSAVEIGEELSKEDPSYAKIGVIAAGDVLGAAIPAAGPVAKSLIKQSDNIESVWSYPKQLYDSADTSINVSKKPAGYNELKKRGEIKDGDVIVDIGGGRFDNLVEDAAEEGATVKVYDPFNRTPEHNAAVVDSVKDGQADMAMSHNVLNVIQEDKNIIDIAVQAENAIKPNGKAHFSVYEGTGKGEGKVTTKGYQRNQKTEAYVPLIEEVFGKGNVTRKGKIITATKNVQGFSEGGMAIEEQMAMNFGDVPDNTVGVDPVSGNEIPLGSTAENVRDDIPAQLSEGEIVVPADVVRFHGVKLFEDLRAAAKMGYAQMNADGRIGGEPIPMNDDDEGLGLELADLEILEMEEPQMMADGGQPRKSYTFDQVKQRMVEQPRKPKFKNRYEELMHKFFGGDDDNKKPSKPRKPRATEKPAIDFGFSGNLSERASRKYGSPSTPTRNEPYRPNIPRPAGFDEGTGLVTSLEGKTGQMLPEGYDPEVDMISPGGGTIEMREYQNAEGHTIMIPFIDGVPQTVIPNGYYPVGSVPVTVGNTTGSSSNNDNDDPGGDIETPEPYNYKELTIDELAEEVENLQATPDFPLKGLLGGIVSIQTERHKNKIIKEINRRLGETSSFNNPNDPSGGGLAIYEREYLENLLEVAKAPKRKGMVGKLLDRITGNETEEPELPNLTGPEFTAETVPLSNEPYKPTTSADPDPVGPTRARTTAEQIQDSIDQKAFVDASKEASKEAAEIAFAPRTETAKLRASTEAAAEDRREDAKDRADDITRIADETGSSIAEVGRDIAPSDEEEDPDYGDPRRGMRKGGIAKKKKKKSK